ncbi:GNAT family N-acetyltransferase, partial [Listeria monocytogenes]|nr:GNAT family N-acetyltransferase [Listeria monocytogenes]
KKPCLFYDNPVAGEIYHRLGFEHTGDFVMYK